MSWLTRTPNQDMQTVQRFAVLNLLRTLEPYLPFKISGYMALLEANHSPTDVLHELASGLSEQFARMNAHIHHLESQFSIQQLRIDWLTAERERLLAEPLRLERDAAQAELNDITIQVECEQAALTEAQNALAFEREARQQEVGKLQGLVAVQNRIIAQQQLRLNDLLGETPTAETARDKYADGR